MENSLTSRKATGCNRDRRPPIGVGFGTARSCGGPRPSPSRLPSLSHPLNIWNHPYKNLYLKGRALGFGLGNYTVQWTRGERDGHKIRCSVPRYMVCSVGNSPKPIGSKQVACSASLFRLSKGAHMFPSEHQNYSIKWAHWKRVV